MSEYRIVIQKRGKNGSYSDSSIIKSGQITKPENIMELGFRHLEQIEIIHRIQESILEMQSVYLKAEITYCPVCGNKLTKNGTTKSTFNSVYTDHKVAVQKLVCKKCKWMSVPSINSLFGTHMHPDLTKMQCEIAGIESYAKAGEILNKKAGKKRTVNNSMTLHNVIEKVGNYISDTPELSIKDDVEPASDLIIQSDGGHIKTVEKEKRSFEAMASVVYRPENVIPGQEENKRGKIIRKHCAVSALEDNGSKINSATLAAARKEGLTKNTKITALCDGADNCWNIIDSLKKHCAGIFRILDWFHITMKFENISVSRNNKDIFERARWSLWHGDLVGCVLKLHEVYEKTKDSKNKNRLKKLKYYLVNNFDKIIDYSERKRKGLIFTSQMAESTIESLINQRCKGKQHMKWSRKGVHSLLQIRAETASNDWELNYESYILGAYAKTA